MERIVHVTGTIIALGPSRVIQRCAICGFKLVDVNSEHRLPDGRPCGTWPIARFLICDEGATPRLMPGMVDGTRFPDQCCVNLLEAGL